jgi:hypothetical protein
MQNIQLFSHNSYTDFIELQMVDGQRRKKNVTILYNLSDDWMPVENSFNSDVEAMFTGVIMEIFKRDNTAFAYKATAYKIEGDCIRKTISFTPMVRIDDEFKECYISEDGKVEFV